MGALAKFIGMQDDAEIKERMEFLHVTAKAKLSQYKEKLNENFINPESIAKAQIPGERSIRYYEQYHVASSQTVSKDMKDHIDQVLDAFFSIGDSGGSTKKAVKSGIKSLISMGFDAFIGSTQAGESESIQYYVIPENNAFVRVDIACWKYNFKDKKFLEQHDMAVAYIFCKSVVDHKKLSLDELIYLVTESMIERGEIDPQFVLLAEKGFNPIEPVAPKAEPTKKADESQDDFDKRHADWEEKNKEYQRQKAIYDEYHESEEYKGFDADKKKSYASYYVRYSHIGPGAPGDAPIPDIANVEAYLDELIRVWKKLAAAEAS